MPYRTEQNSKAENSTLSTGADGAKTTGEAQAEAGQCDEAGKAGEGAGTAESGAARVRRILIEPLSGLARPRRVSEAQHRDNLDRLARKLSYMDEPQLRGLAEFCLGFAGAAGTRARVVPQCPADGLILSWAYGLQPPPVRRSDYFASVLRSVMGRRCYDSGMGVELLRMCRRFGPPPQAYSMVQMRDEAAENRRRRDALRRAVEAGQALSPDQDRWLKGWHEDAQVVAELVAEGDDRRAAKAAGMEDAA